MALTLSSAGASRLPLMEGLRLTAQTVHNRVLRGASDEIVEAIRGGGSLSAALRRSGVFPPLLVYLAASGEAAGQLDTMLARGSEEHTSELQSLMRISYAVFCLKNKNNSTSLTPYLESLT